MNIPQNPNGQATMANSSPMVIASDQSTLPVSAASLPLPTGASTSALQTTGNTSLSSIDTKTPALGQALAAASVPIVLTAAQLTTLTPPAAIAGFATSALQTTGNTSVASIDTKTPALGQALAAASVPVVLTAAQITTLTPPAAITGYALDATLTGGTQQTKLTDGTNVATVKAASTAALATDKALVVAISPNNSVAVTGTFWQATQPVSGTFWQATQPISGTVTTTPPANASTNVAQFGGTNVVNGGVAGVQSVGGNVANAVTATANPVPVGGVFTTAPTTLTTGQTATLQFTAAQNVKTDLTTIGATAIDTNSGNKSAGTQRFVLATDQPNLTTALNVALAANQSVNVAQINGVTPLMGNGVTGTGSQRVTLASDGTAISTVGYMSVKFDQTTVGTTNAVSLAQIGATTVLTGNGVAGAGAQRVTIASDNTAFAVNATLSAETTKVIGTVRNLGNAGAITDGVNTAATAPANGVLGLGIYNSTEPSPTTGQSVGIQLDLKGRTRTVVMDAAGNTRGQNINANNAGLVALDQTTVGTTNGVTQVPATSGGLTTFHLASAATTNLTTVKASAGQLYGYVISNTSAAYSYIAFHNSATTPTAGASIFFKIGIPAGGGANVHFNNGIPFSTGISISTVTGAADNNTTAVALNDLIINLFYK